MWKRTPRHTRGKDAQIGEPVLIETTYADQNIDDLPTSPTALSPGYRQLSHSPLASSSQNASMLEPPRGHRSQVSDASTVNSVYSHQSPAMPYNWNEHAASSSRPTDQPDVSPPSSPGASFADRSHGAPSSGRVSPLSDYHNGPVNASAATHTRTTHIPVPRKAVGTPARSRDVTPSPLGTRMLDTGKRQPLWETFSGESADRTQGTSGQNSSPGGTGTKLGRTNESDAGSPSPISGSPSPTSGNKKNYYKKPSLAERAARFSNRALSVETKPREPWKGASGRTAIIPPVSENTKPRSKPLSGFRKSVSKQPQPSHDAPPAAARHHTQSPEFTQSPQAMAASPTYGNHDYHDPNIRPVVPLKVGIHSPTRAVASPASPMSRFHGYPSPITPNSGQPTPIAAPQPLRSNPASKLLQGEPEFSPSSKKFMGTSTTTPRKSTERNPDQPSSRFSWTTFATGTSYQSPPPSPPPEIPKEFVAQSPARVPVHRHSVSESIPAPPRKPMPRRTDSESKALPVPPSQQNSTDLISNLQSQLDDLEERRRGIRRRIWDLTQPQNPVLVDLAARRERTRKLKHLEDNLADISNQEHDVGLRLHRAYKRRDIERSEEPTALWVKRVTE